MFHMTNVHLIKNNNVDELWEEVSTIPHATLYAIDKRSAVSYIVDLASQMIQYFCTITQQHLYYDHIRNEKQCVTFLQSNATVAIDETRTLVPKYIHLNRFQITNANLLSDVQKKNKLYNQILLLPTLVKVLFFIKNHKNQKSIISCSQYCKIVNCTARFLNLEPDLLNKFHEILCRPPSKLTKLENLERLYYAFPSEKNTIKQTLSYLESL